MNNGHPDKEKEPIYGTIHPASMRCPRCLQQMYLQGYQESGKSPFYMHVDCTTHYSYRSPKE